MAAAQGPTPPLLPYSPPKTASTFPATIVSNAQCLTTVTLSALSGTPRAPFPYILNLLHQLSLASLPLIAAEGHRLDARMSCVLYEAEYALLQVLCAQKADPGVYEPMEVVLAEAGQMYFWTAIRCLPPAIALCELFEPRLKRALTPLIRARRIAALSSGTGTLHFQVSGTEGEKERSERDGHADLLTWCLFLGAAVSSYGPRPVAVFKGDVEVGGKGNFEWYRAQFWEHWGEGKTSRRLGEVLRKFPMTDALLELGLSVLERSGDGVFLDDKAALVSRRRCDGTSNERD
jgi:hypothetical protein